VYADPKELASNQRNPQEKSAYIVDVDAALRRAASRQAMAGFGICAQLVSHQTNPVRQFFVAHTNVDGNPAVQLVVGLGYSSHGAVFLPDMPAAEAVKRLRALADEIEAGATKRMENHQ